MTITRHTTTMVTRDPIGQMLRAARKQAGLSQERLAERIGCDRQRVIAWESGRNRPSGRYSDALSEVHPAFRAVIEQLDEDSRPFDLQQELGDLRDDVRELRAFLERFLAG